MNKILESLFIFVCVLFIYCPIATLFHELGHALFTLLFIDEDVIISLGDAEKKGPKLKFKRLVIYLSRPIILTGMCFWGNINQKDNAKNKKILILLGGPLASAITIIACIVICISTTNIKIVNRFFNYGLWFSIIQFISAIIPMTYESGPIKNTDSDGKHIKDLLMEK